jgi:outer membrane biosynthesis protein TonB
MVHGVALALALWSARATRVPLDFVTYQIEIFSPPVTVEAEEPAPAKEELVVERPEPPPPQPEERPTVQNPPPPEPKPTKEPEEEKKPATSPAPEERSPESGENVNVRLEGLRRDYPAYYENIITQIGRCFQWRGGGSWETTVYFVIKRDGTVSDIDFVKRSGNAGFDFQAMGAVECAGANGRLGGLPEALPFDRLPIQFSFRPQGGIREDASAASATRDFGSQR